MAGDTADAPAAPPSHYERLGGAATVQRAVELFYDRVDITDGHDDRVVDHLVGVLSELGADDDALAAAGAVVAAVRPDIVVGGGAGA